MLSVLLLGPPQLMLDGRPLALTRRKNRALLYYLAAHEQPLTRDQLLAFFWIDHARPAAQQNLRTLLHDLRRQLGSALVVQDDTIGLAPETEIDARRFGSGISSITLDPARDMASLPPLLDLYRGDFLDGFALSDPPEFDDWVTAERERYRMLARRGWLALASQYEGQARYADAATALERALSFDPLNEQVQQAALRVQYLNGDRAGAIRRFDQLRQRLDEELGVPPLPETRALYDQIITDTLPRTPRASPPRLAAPGPLAPRSRAVPAGTPPPRLPFTGRERDLETMNALNSAGQLIWITGEPGIGKTRLAEEFIAQRLALAEAPPMVLRGAAHELEQNLPYQPIVDALRSELGSPEWAQLQLAPVWLAEFARLIPELPLEPAGQATLPPTLDDSRLWQALHHLLLALSRARPVILFLDDVHWADTSTLGVLGYLARRARSDSFTLLVTARAVPLDSPAARLLQSLTHEGRLVQLEPAALSTRDVDALAARLSPARAASLAGWLNENAEGNPFFINELVRYAYDRQVLYPDGSLDEAALIATPVMTPTIHNLITSRLLRLDPEPRRVLHTAALIGREFEFALVARVTGLTEDATLDALDALERAGLVRAQGGESFVFDHHLTMQVAGQAVGAARRGVLHRRIAEGLIELYSRRLDPIAGLVARHLVEGGEPPRAAPYAARAGDYASGLAAWHEAIAFYEQALPYTLSDAERTHILLNLARGYLHNGEMRRASELFYETLALARATGNLAQIDAVLVGLNQSMIPQGRFDEAIALAQEIGETESPDLQLAVELSIGTALNVQGLDPRAAEQHLRRAEALLEAPRGFTSQVTRAMLKYQLAGVHGQQGKFQEAIGLYWQALNLVRENPSALDLQRHILLYNNLAYYLLLVDDPSAMEYARAGLQLARDKGTLTHKAYLLSTAGEIALAHQELDSAAAYLEEGLELAGQMGILERVAGIRANLGRVALAQGEPGRAEQLLKAALEEATEIDALHLAVRIRIWLAPLLPPDEARAALDLARRIATSSQFAGLLAEIEKVRAQLLLPR